MKKWLIVILIIFLGINGVLFWFYKQAGIKKQNQVSQTQITSQTAQYPYFPEGTETSLDTESKWQRKSFQPIFKEFVEASSGSYLVVNYAVGAGGEAEEGKVFLRGQIAYVDETSSGSLIGPEKLKELLKPGDQFGVEYLAKIPADFSLEMPRCQNQQGRPVECILAYFKQESDQKGEKAFYPFFVYRVLKQ
jgi:hypothetical protein